MHHPLILETKNFFLQILDSYTAAAAFIIFGISADVLDYTHKGLVVLAGLLIVIKGTYSLITKYRDSKIDKELKETELKILKKKLKEYH
jgi:hypothetical protein